MAEMMLKDAEAPVDLASLAARLAALESQVALAADKAAVEDVLTRYSRSLDWLDADALESVFFDDAAIDYGFFKGTGAEFKPLLMELERSVGRRWHFTAQVKVALAGDVAEVESYNFSLAVPTDGSDPAAPPADFLQFFGFYKDRLERRGGQWGIAARKHLLVTGTQAREIAMTGDFGALNRIGMTGPDHADYRKLD